ncbi:MAG: hypothetical protein ACRC2S_23990 [Waterburya sp.]
MLLTSSLRKSILRKFFSILNQVWFWWTLFVVDQALIYILVPLLTNISIEEFIPIWLGEFVVFLVIAQFIIIMFWIPQVVTRVELYGHWRGREVAERIKHETAAHQELDRLREAMIFGEPEGDSYWSVIQQLDPVGDNNSV